MRKTVEGNLIRLFTATYPTMGVEDKTTLMVNPVGLLSELGQCVLRVKGDVQPVLSIQFDPKTRKSFRWVATLVNAQFTDTTRHPAVGDDIILSNAPEDPLTRGIMETRNSRFRCKRSRLTREKPSTTL